MCCVLCLVYWLLFGVAFARLTVICWPVVCCVWLLSVACSVWFIFVACFVWSACCAWLALVVCLSLVFGQALVVYCALFFVWELCLGCCLMLAVCYLY